MRSFVFFLLFMSSCLQLPAQILTGKWKGYFTPNIEQDGKIYSYEMDIIHEPNLPLKVLSFTKFSAQYSAKAYANGSFDKKTGLVSIIEQSFDEIKINAQYQACLMTNYLMYKNIRGHEIIEGTYTSKNTLTQKDCGGGQVYLEKDIPIVKLMKPDSNKKSKDLIAKKSTPIATSTSTSNSTVNASSLQSLQISTLKEESTPIETKAIEPEEANKNTSIPQNNNFQTVPWLLVVRENKLVKELTTSSKQFSIDLYDNGTIDNDTINVYDNKQLIVNKKRLSYKAIHLEFNFTDAVNEHEVIIVAHNMGTVPPNTALLVLKDSDKRQEYFITSTNKMNAKLVIKYKPGSP